MFHPFISRHANKIQILWSPCHPSIENYPPTHSSHGGVSVGVLGPQGSGSTVTHHWLVPEKNHAHGCTATCSWHFLRGDLDYQDDAGSCPAAVFETPIVITAWNIVWNQELLSPELLRPQRPQGPSGCSATHALRPPSLAQALHQLLPRK